jgi:phosphatidylinositol 3-kinase
LNEKNRHLFIFKLQVQDKFVLHLNDEEAVQYMQNLIEISASAMMATLMENFHKMAQVRTST